MATKKKINPEANGNGNEIEEIIAPIVTKVSEEEQTAALATIKPTDLKHLKELDVEIDDYRKNYSELKIVDENDAEGYELVRAALGVMRPKRTGLDRERKSVTEPYRSTIAYINSQYEEKINAIAKIEEPLKARKKEIDEIEERKKEQKKQEEEQRLINRIDSLIKNGAVFNGEYYSIYNEEFGVAEISVGVVDIRSMSDDLFKQFLQQVIDKNEFIKSKQEEKVRIQQEYLKEKQEEEQRQRDEFERQQNLLKQQQQELEKKQNAMAEQMKKLQDAQDKARMNQLTALGLTYNDQHKAFVFMDVNVDVMTELRLLEEEPWNRLIEKITPVVTQRKEEAAETQRKENDKQLRVASRVSQLKELDTKIDSNHQAYFVSGIVIRHEKIANDSQEEWDKLMTHLQGLVEEAKEKQKEEIKQQAIREQQEKEQREREQKEQEMAAASDKTKWGDYLERIKAVAIPEMKSAMYKKKATEVSEFIKALK